MNPDEVPQFIQVDDDPDDRFFLREALEQSTCPYQPLEFKDGVTFLEFLGQKPQTQEVPNMSWLLILDCIYLIPVGSNCSRPPVPIPSGSAYP